MPIQRTLATVVLAQRCFSLASLPSAHNVSKERKATLGLLLAWYHDAMNTLPRSPSYRASPAIMLSHPPASRLQVLYGTRYGDGRVVGTAAKSITDLCCKAGSDPGTDSLLLRQALWAASYGTKLGGAKVRVSDPKFQPFAEWLVATSATLTGGDKNA